MIKEQLSLCKLCPRNCSVDRTSGKVGYCGAGEKIKIGRNALHFWEEPPISGENGSGTVFFSNCNMGCVYCQNYEISTKNSGKIITTEELTEIFLDLQNQKAHNINLVTPTHYIPQIARALTDAKKKGLKIPVVYNSGGYENVSALKQLFGLIDIYMPDIKYFSDEYAIKYSNAPNYFNCATKALSEMFLQVGKNQFDGNGLMTKGVIVRHMMLPGLLFDSKKIIDYLYSTYKDDLYISIMSQYTPMPWIKKYPELDRKVTQKYYDTLVDYAVSIGVKNAFIQDLEAVGKSFIPEFYKED